MALPRGCEEARGGHLSSFDKVAAHWSLFFYPGAAADGRGGFNLLVMKHLHRTIIIVTILFTISFSFFVLFFFCFSFNNGIVSSSSQICSSEKKAFTYIYIHTLYICVYVYVYIYKNTVFCMLSFF